MKKDLFSKIRMIEFTCTKDLCMIIHENKSDTKKKLRSHHFIGEEKLGKYLSRMLSIDIDEADLEKKKNQFINDIINFNNKHIIQ